MNSLTRGVVVSALLLALGSPAWADSINIRPVDPLGDNGTEDTLQEIFDDLTVSGPGIDAVDDQTPYALFTSTASGASIATFVIEVTAGAASQEFGIYDAHDNLNKVVLFDGGDTAGDQVAVSFLSDGSIRVNFIDAGIDFASNTFGFFLDSGVNSFYSEDSLNGGDARALIYQGDGETTLQIDPFAAGTFSPNEWIIAFEDGGDNDFQDAVVLVESIEPVPEPGTLALCGAAVLGFAWFRRRKRA